MKATPLQPGDTFGHLTVIEALPGDRRGTARARVRCECGREKVVYRTNLHSGRARSCGCARRELAHATRHTAARPVTSQTPEYRSWACAKTRVTNAREPGWKYYGARGISMCEEWLHDFAAFLAHIGPRPGPGYTLDRIDNEGGYAPGNVRWATWSEQRRNQRPRQAAA